jgi:hypothetical protein
MTQPTQPFQPPPSQPPPQRMAPPRKQKRFGFLALAITTLVSLGIGGAVGGSGDGATTATPAPAPTVTETVEAPAPEAEPQPTVTVTAAAPKEKAQPKPEPEPDMGEGTYEVGKDVKAGQYKTTVPADSDGCYWERSKDDSGDSIITNDLANPGAKVSVTIKKGEFFKSNGCGDWVRQ